MILWVNHKRRKRFSVLNYQLNLSDRVENSRDMKESSMTSGSTINLDFRKSQFSSTKTQLDALLERITTVSVENRWNYKSRIITNFVKPSIKKKDNTLGILKLCFSDHYIIINTTNTIQFNFFVSKFANLNEYSRSKIAQNK